MSHVSQVLENGIPGNWESAGKPLSEIPTCRDLRFPKQMWVVSGYSGITSQNRMNGNFREAPTRPTLTITAIEVVTIAVKTPASTFCTRLGILLDHPTV